MDDGLERNHGATTEKAASGWRRLRSGDEPAPPRVVVPATVAACAASAASFLVSESGWTVYAAAFGTLSACSGAAIVGAEVRTHARAAAGVLAATLLAAALVSIAGRGTHATD